MAKDKTQWEKNFEVATKHVSSSEKKALEAENKRGLEDRERLVKEAEVFKKGSNAELHRKNQEATNGPDGAQAQQPLPEDVDVDAHATPTSKPQNTVPDDKQL